MCPRRKQDTTWVRTAFLPCCFANYFFVLGSFWWDVHGGEVKSAMRVTFRPFWRDQARGESLSLMTATAFLIYCVSTICSPLKLTRVTRNYLILTFQLRQVQRHGLTLKFLTAFSIFCQCFPSFNFFVFCCCKNILQKQLGRERVNFLSVPDCRLLGSQGIRKLKQLILSMGAHVHFLFSSGPQIQGRRPPTLDNIIQSLQADLM